MDITQAYANMVRQYQGLETDSPFKDKIAIWYTFEALKEVNRPDEIDWKLIQSVRKVAWKTGTSYGYRDAWAVGVTPDYAVGVWCGNADGHGVAGMTGAKTAGPVLFDLLNLLPPSADWFQEPLEGGVFLEVCTASGMLSLTMDGSPARPVRVMFTSTLSPLFIKSVPVISVPEVTPAFVLSLIFAPLGIILSFSLTLPKSNAGR